MIESLAAHGIARDRLVPLDAGYSTRFAELHDVADVWHDGPHPDALAILAAPQALPGPVGPPPPSRFATLRRHPEQRALHNGDEVGTVLRDRGIALVDLHAMPFAEQVRLFRLADLVVGSLGSNVAGAIFARESLPVMTMAPSAWEDGYFIRLFQRTGARHADIRGPSTLFGGEDAANASHLADPWQIERGLAALQDVRPRSLTVDGETVPRALGPRVLSVDFGAAGNAHRFTRAGWAAAEHGHRWSMGAEATLVFDGVPFPAEDIWLEIEGMGHVYRPHMPTRPLCVSANGTIVGQFDIVDDVRLFCRIQAAVMAGGDPLRLTVQHPIRPSPKLMGNGEDGRRLGFGFRSLAFYGV